MKYLVYIGTGIGDFIISLPVMRAIKEYDRDAFITLFSAQTKEKVAEKRSLYELQSMANKILSYSIKQPLYTLWNMIQLRLENYDYGLIAHYTNMENTSIWPSMIASLVCRKTIGISVPKNKKIKFDIEVPRVDSLRVIDNYELLLKEIDPSKSSNLVV